MRQTLTALAAVLVSACALAGCGHGNPYELPNYDGTPVAPAAAGASRSPRSTGSAPSTPERTGPVGQLITASPAATPPSDEVTYSPADAWGEGAWVERGTIVAHSAPERAAVEAVTKYMSVRVQLSNTWQVDEAALAAVASGEAVTTARQRAQRQQADGQRSIGRFIINVSSVHVSGDQATVTGCHFDATSEVDQAGNVLVPPPGGVLITMKVRRTGSIWRVVDWPDHAAPVCDWRS
jgi:predicted small lipoprotein YifL